jgi:phosphoribosylformimino-5-aminoimidazole carboxamide ribotide isomerase
VFSNDPAAMARKWAMAGAELIHVIDLDGAFEKSPRNVAAIRNILKTVNIPIQLGGGIRTEQTIRMFLDMGVHRVIIGTEAINNPQLVEQSSRIFPGQIIVGIDAREGHVAIEGWKETTPIKAVDLAKQFENCGVAAINFTDIYRDGMQTGPNISETGFSPSLSKEFFRALVNRAGMNLHINVSYGENEHHVIESIFKAFGRALDQASAFDQRVDGVRSSKGVL